MFGRSFDVIVIGGGHAGTEAAWAAASALGDGARVALLTMDPAAIGRMSCNPAIGGLAKGQMVREIDALGGIMGRAIDATGIMFRMLNTSKGSAVHGPRAQADKYAYSAEIQRLIATRPEIEVIAGTVEDLLVEKGWIRGVVLAPGASCAAIDERAIEENRRGETRAQPILGRSSGPPASDRLVLETSAVVLTTGTFMRGLMHTGDERTVGGRVGEAAAVGISPSLTRHGFELGRLKTGTPPRLARESIDWDSLEAQPGDDVPVPFSDLSPHALAGGRFPSLPQVECRLTHTCAEAHELIRANLHRAPMYSGQIEAETGPRYCPSIEDKVVRFAARESHHVFLEPESLHTNEIYCNGISTSLPTEVQERLVRLMPGCERAEFLRFGYAVEYDMVWPHQIDATCMTKRIEGLFLAGQINCTTGYEEAGAQGVVAGLNAARFANGADLARLGREEAYIGVMLDDLVTKRPREPYRMFTSRAEHRLLLRADNTDERLTPRGREWGLVDDVRWRAWEARSARIDALRGAIGSAVVDGRPLREIARRPETTAREVARLLGCEDELGLIERVVTEIRYEGYVARQQAEVRRRAETERKHIPSWIEPSSVKGLRAEAVEVLARFRPTTLGQAGRLAGVNPADLTLLAVAIARGQK